MPHSFDFDWKHRILRTRFYGRVTDEELKKYYRSLYQNFFRLQPTAGVACLSETTVFDVSAEAVRELANSAPALHDPTRHRIIVAPSPELYRMARTFQMWAKTARPNLHVVRTEQEAWAILEILNPEFVSLEPE